MEPVSEAVRIRPARDRELERAGELAVQAFARLRGLLTPENRSVMEEGVRFATAIDTKGRLLVAELSGEVVGTVRYTGPGQPDHPIYPERFAYLRALAVSPQHLRHGIGRALTRACVAAARRDRAEALVLLVADANATARRLYEGLGFEPYRELPDYLGILHRAYCLRLSPDEAMEGKD